MLGYNYNLESGVGREKKIAHWAHKFSTDALGEMCLIICNKIVYGYIIDATIK